MMEKNAKIYVAGHRGMVGSAIVRELERQGYVYTTSGVGTFVADRDEIRADARELEAAKAAFDEAFRELLFLGLSYEEAKAIALEIMEERRTSND